MAPAPEQRQHRAPQTHRHLPACVANSRDRLHGALKWAHRDSRAGGDPGTTRHGQAPAEG